jgi:hypothetical protein
MSNKATKQEPTIDEVIAATLASTPTSSNELFELVIRVTSEIEALDERWREAQEQSVNPLRLDSDALRSEIDSIMFRTHRLRNGLVALQQKYDEVLEREQSTAWRANADRIQKTRDQLVDEFAQRYPELVGELVNLFNRVANVDKEIDRLHGAAPASESVHRLCKVEAKARNVDFVQGGASIIEGCKLLNLTPGHQAASFAWPQAHHSDLGDQLFPQAGGAANPADDKFYEPTFDESLGYFVMRRKSDAPLLNQFVPPQHESMHDAMLAEHAGRAVESARHVAEGIERERSKV